MLLFGSAVLTPLVMDHAGPLGLLGLADWLMWVVWIVAHGLVLMRRTPVRSRQPAAETGPFGP